MAASSFTLGSLAQRLGAELQGDANLDISGLATLQDATQGDLAFLANPIYKKHLHTTSASAVILSVKDSKGFSGNALIIANPYAAYARLTALFCDSQTEQHSVIHPTAVIADSAVIGEGVVIGPHVVIEDHVVIGKDCRITANVFIGHHTQVGEGSLVHSGVSIYHHSIIGRFCIFHSGVVIGADGFGFAPDGEEWVKIHHLAGVVIGDHVELGANTCVDRGALADTVIEQGVKIDNMVQIAHGVKIGRYTVVAGCSAIAGSAEIGAHCLIGGCVGIVGHIKIADRTTITGMSLVSKSITQAGSYSSGVPLMPSREWRKSAVRVTQLDDLYRRIKKLENLE